MKRFKFSKTQIDKIGPTDKRQYFYDEGQKGLRLSVTPNGTKSYQFQSRGGTHGKPITMTIARYGDISITDARRKAAELLAEVKQGADPERDKSERRAEVALNDVFLLYVENYAKLHKRSWKADVDQYRNHFENSIGKKRPSEISKRTVQAWMKKLAVKSGFVTANRAHALLSIIFNTQLDHLNNPCIGIKKYPEKSRARFLKPEELKRFFQSLSLEKKIYRDFFSLLLLTGARKGNVLAMRWDQIVDEMWIIPSSASKNRRQVIIPLVGRASQILNSRREGDSKFVFPGSGSSGHLADPKKSWLRILKRAELEDLHIHDLRRTFASFQAMAGANMAIIGASLGHSGLGSTAVYTQLQTDSVKKSVELATDAIFGNGTEKD